MTKNPIINAGLALVYIIIVASIMFYGIESAESTPSILVPVFVLSLFTLSAAVMGYLFFNQPIQMYLADKKKEAIALFLQTIAVFAGFTFIAFLITLMLGR